MASFLKSVRGVMLIGVLLGAAFLLWQSPLGRTTGAYPEADELREKQLSSFSELSSYFQDLALKKGAAYAYEVLKVVPVPPNIDMHLLAHVVGDILYSQEGLKGIEVCTHDFRNACSHSIVIGLLLEQGPAALPDIGDACRAAPGGKGAYTMCFHGLGHGVLAYNEYELPAAVEMCETMGTPAYNNREAVECVGGVIMEAINGVHDLELWAEKKIQYFSRGNPLHPCTADFMPEEMRPQCLIYLTPYLWEFAGADLGAPGPQHFEQAFQYCSVLPINDAAGRDACYGGFGKEFVGLVLGRDIRASAVERVSDGQLQQVYEWCLLADAREGSAACMMHALQSFYWGGENDRTIAFRYCGLMNDEYFQRSCYMNLIRAVSFYVDDQTYRKEFCAEMPRSYVQECFQELL